MHTDGVQTDIRQHVQMLVVQLHGPSSILILLGVQSSVVAHGFVDELDLYTTRRPDDEPVFLHSITR